MGSSPSSQKKKNENKTPHIQQVNSADVNKPQTNQTQTNNTKDGKTVKPNMTSSNSAAVQALIEDTQDPKVKSQAKSSVENLKQNWAFLHDGTKVLDEKRNYIQPVTEAIHATYKAQYERGLTHPQVQAYRKVFYTYLADCGVVTFFCDFLVHVFKEHCQPAEDQDEEVTTAKYTYLSSAKQILNILVNFTDEYNERSTIIRDHPSYLPFMAAQLKTWYGLFVDEQATNMDISLIHSAMNTTYNLTMNRDNVEKINILNYKENLIPYLKISKDPDLRLTSLAALANLVDEKESEILRTDNKVLIFLIKTIERALADSRHRAFGWSADELAKVVRRIAKNDNNKRILVELGVLQQLVSMAGKEDVNEQREAVKAMWTLSFDEENVKTMINDESCTVIDTFIDLKTSSKDEKVRNTCHRALWTLREKLAQSDRYKEIGKEFMGSKKDNSATTDTMKGHVMISYQWNDQPLLKKVRNEIKKHNFQVWMDIDDMEGSTIDAMAAAVEEASVVLVCASKRYKDSDNCRAEAQYAWKLKKPIVPLFMERGYKADGWLGLIVGTKLFFDFSGKYDFESRMDGLAKELMRTLNRGKADETDHIKPVAASKLESGPAAVSVHSDREVYASKPVLESKQKPVLEEIKAWSSDNVNTWLGKHGLSRKKFATLTGIDIAFLLLMKQEVSGDFFYKTLLDLLKITDLSTLSRVRFALEDTSLP